MHTHQVDHQRRAWSAAIALWIGLAVPAAAQSRLVLPAGSVILVRTTAPLQSASAQTGQSFETTVDQSVGVDEYTIIPAGSRIRGQITVARPATRQQSGVIEVVFNRIVLSDGTTVPITGKLTSTDSAERRQIERDPNARVVLVGERGGIGAAIAGAGQSQSPNNIFAALGSLLSEGRDVNVPAGTPLAVEIEQAVSLRGRGRVSAGDANTIYTAAERIRDAQTALAQRKYYRGAINGQLDDPTRLALFQFQADAGFRATGNLDGRTARALGVNIAGGVTGAALSADVASSVRRDAQSLVSRLRAELGSSGVGRLNPSRSYSQGDLEAWFALSAFADNASLYEQVVRGGDNANATVFAGRALMGAARRVDAALQSARVSSSLQSAWSSLRGQLSPIDTQG
ncbi:MAG TPA: peptidoglycan-binding domain-containing protein [Gemmatimonadaceae bacterium]